MPKRKKEFKWFPEHLCKNGCGKMIPIPMDFCSSKCEEEFKKQTFIKDNSNSNK